MCTCFFCWFADASRRLKWNSPQTTRCLEGLIHRTLFLLPMYTHLVRICSVLVISGQLSLDVTLYMFSAVDHGVDGLYRVRAVDYWGRPGLYSLAERYSEEY